MEAQNGAANRPASVSSLWTARLQMDGFPARSSGEPRSPQSPPGRLWRPGAGRKRTTRPRGMPTGSLVRGFRATPVLRGAAWNRPNRRSTTRSPRSSAEPTLSSNAFTASCAAHCSRSVVHCPSDEVRLDHAEPIIGDPQRGAGAIRVRNYRRSRYEGPVCQLSPASNSLSNHRSGRAGLP